MESFSISWDLPFLLYFGTTHTSSQPIEHTINILSWQHRKSSWNPVRKYSKQHCEQHWEFTHSPSQELHFQTMFSALLCGALVAKAKQIQHHPIKGLISDIYQEQLHYHDSKAYSNKLCGIYCCMINILKLTSCSPYKLVIELSMKLH